jgi:uncharacterized membrane protein
MFGYLKNAIFRGLVILIPVVLVYITIRELVEIMIGFATPIADLLPKGWILQDDPIELVAVDRNFNPGIRQFRQIATDHNAG